MIRLAGVALALLLAPGIALAAEGERCKVTDPTGTPLNVRDGPNGTVIGTLPNGALVSIVASQDAANGKPWVKIVDHTSKKPIGWVFREFVSCF